MSGQGNIPATYGWQDALYSTALSLTPGTGYVIGIVIDSYTARIKYDTGTGGTSHRDDYNFSYSAAEAFNWSATGDYVYSLYATYYSSPTITSSVISDMDDADNIYTMKKYYTFTTVIADSDGGSDIASISIRGAQGASVRWMVNATNLAAVPAYTITSGDTVIDLDAGSCSWTAGASSGTLILAIRFEWDATQEDNCELEVWASDAGGHTVGWTTVHSDYYDVISRLVTRDFAGNLTSTTINMPVQITGYVRYATTTTGTNASTSYPPDAQFTAVKIYDDQSEYAGEDTTIVNGFFNLTITSRSTLRTTYYYAWLDLVPDYTDGYAVDADYVVITTYASFSIIDTVNEGFTFFGLAGNVTGVIIPTITSLAGWFSDSATAVVDMVSGVLTLVIYVSGTVTYWVSAFSTFFINLFNAINRVAHGTGGTTDWYTAFNVAAWIGVVPIFAFIWWYDLLPKRAKRAGVTMLEIAIRDLQIASYIVGEVWNWTFTLFNFVVNSVMTFVSVVTG